jgi:hypothetical protein
MTFVELLAIKNEPDHREFIFEEVLGHLSCK